MLEGENEMLLLCSLHRGLRKLVSVIHRTTNVADQTSNQARDPALPTRACQPRMEHAKPAKREVHARPRRASRYGDRSALSGRDAARGLFFRFLDRAFCSGPDRLVQHGFGREVLLTLRRPVEPATHAADARGREGGVAVHKNGTPGETGVEAGDDLHDRDICFELAFGDRPLDGGEGLGATPGQPSKYRSSTCR